MSVVKLWDSAYLGSRLDLESEVTQWEQVSVAIPWEQASEVPLLDFQLVQGWVQGLVQELVQELAQGLAQELAQELAQVLALGLVQELQKWVVRPGM